MLNKNSFVPNGVVRYLKLQKQSTSFGDEQRWNFYTSEAVYYKHSVRFIVLHLKRVCDKHGKLIPLCVVVVSSPANDHVSVGCQSMTIVKRSEWLIYPTFLLVDFGIMRDFSPRRSATFCLPLRKQNMTETNLDFTTRVGIPMKSIGETT